jgi:ribosomal protein L6P/L9E
MVIWLEYIFKPPFVDYLELSCSYILVNGLSENFYIPKFVTTKSKFSFFRKKLHNLALQLKTFFQILHVKGIGFKVYYYKKTTSLYFNLGYNHICKYCLAGFAAVKVRKQYLLIFTTIRSIMFYINEIKNLRFPDPYRGKGIRFRFQEMKFKPGKQR